MMEPVKREMRLICVHAPPVSEEWIHYIEYMGGLLGAELVYRHTLGRAGVLSAAAGEKDVILLHEPASARLQLALGRTMSERLAGRGPASVLVVHRPRWPLDNILLILRAEPGDEAAIEWTRALARRSGAAVTVLPILPPIPALYTWRRDGRLDAGQLLASNTPAAARLRRLLGQFDQEQTPASVHLGPGEPLWQMRDEMADHDYDLAIAGAEPAGRLHRFLVGDLLGPLLHSANCPVFVARNAPELGLAGTIQPSRSVTKMAGGEPSLTF